MPLYDRLVCLDPFPVVALNRAIAAAELDGAHVALAIVDGLADALSGYATRAELLRRVCRIAESLPIYDRAIELAGNTAEAAYLRRRRDQVVSGLR